MSCGNYGVNMGTSTRLAYDIAYADDRTFESTQPIQSVLDPNRVKNCRECLPLFGPRSSHNGYGDNIAVEKPSVTPAQDLVDIDSIMSNRNVKLSKDKKGLVNPINVLKYKTYDVKYCDRGLDPLSSVSTYPKSLYREMSINRFIDNPINPQVNLYWNKSRNTQLELKDNYVHPYPYSLDSEEDYPKEITGNGATFEGFGTCGVPVRQQRKVVVPPPQSIPTPMSEPVKQVQIKEQFNNYNYYSSDSDSDYE